METMLTSLIVAVLLDSSVGHGLVGYIQKDGSTEICTLRSTMGNADGNYGPLTVSASSGDACGNPPGTPKKVLSYSGDGRDLRETQAGSGPYWLNPQETDATCRFKQGDKINAFVYISGNHGGTATWEHRALRSREGKISNEDFELIPNATWDYSSSGPPETSKALGPHVETFTLPTDLQVGWQTLRWNWVAPGPVQFVHCVDVQIDASGESSTTTGPAATTSPGTSPTTTDLATTTGVLPAFGDWPAECEVHPCAHVAMLPAEVLISMKGPADVWFGVGFDAVQMFDAPYAIIVSGDGAVSERKLALHSAGNELASQITLLEQSLANGMRTVVLTRAAAGLSEEHHTFTGDSINYIWAYGLQSNLGFHAKNFGRWAACEPIGVCNPRWCNVNEAFSWCASQEADSCDPMWCKTGDNSLALPRATPATAPTQTTTAVPGIPGFVAVDGGSNRACRGASSADNSGSYYTVVPGSVPSLEACKAECLSVIGCVGIEHKPASGRCEVWTRTAGIGATAPVQGFQCWRYQGRSLLAIKRHTFRGSALLQGVTQVVRLKNQSDVHDEYNMAPRRGEECY